MPKSQLEDISQAQQERLFHIEFKLFFLGMFNRNDLVSRFGIKEAAATRDISLYKELAPKNLEYDTKAKTYIKRDTFKPIFEYSGSQTLAALFYGFGDDFVGTHKALLPSESPTQLNFPQLETLAGITRAIHSQKPLKIHYRSLSSGLTEREIVPFALVDNGLRWHVRAYDRKRQNFMDLVVNRVAKPKLLSDRDISDHEKRDADIQWNRIVEMHIIPHPSLKFPETIEQEYGMVGGRLKIYVRAAVAGYVLRRWNVDCSENHSLTGAENHLWLQNRQTLYGVENLVIAPGYSPDAAECMDSD